MIGLAPPEYDPAAPTTATTLPVAATATVRTYVRELLRRHRRAFALLIGVNAVAVIASMSGPYLLGSVVDALASGARELHLERTVALFAVALLVQTFFVRLVRLRGAMLGEEMLADLREDFLVRAVGLPPGVLERAGTGDLLSRITTDVDRLSNAMREAVPQLAIGVVWAGLLLGGLAVTSPPLALAALLAAPLLVVGGRWYFKRAPSAYRSESAGYAAVAAALAETVDAGRTVEAHRLGDRRIALSNRRITEWVAWERYTLFLRSVLFPVVNVTHMTVLCSVLLLGGVFVLQGWIDVGQLTTGALLAQMLVDPIGIVLRWYDELQVAQVSLARLVGVRDIEPDAGDTEVRPEGRAVRADDVRFGYREGVDVLHEVSLTVAPGSRIALVGPSGAGKSTLGRLLAGIYAPRTGSVTLGAAELARMPAERVREHVALVNQEHHVFVGTLRDNLLLARTGASDTELWAALTAVDAEVWARGLDEGLDTEVGSGGRSLSPAQAQQIALARLVLADPHTLVLDEATSLLDPRAARHLERSLGRVLDGRTVVAIAHRLHTAHDADLIAVVESGRITELGSHTELVAANGAYAALWRSWHG
ncbi:ABC transporter ATP-binding protein [Streptomyces exfoliatus]|uniref:ABC transporter ATP-binding protein n=1 Tax=Streptomyces exfoliatus TaxID=1905 RepID=A0ABV3CTQ7_STREX